MLNEIKWAYQRVVRGYDDRIMWQFDGYFAQIIPALQEFCINQLQDLERIKLNEERSKVFSKTLDLIEEYQNPTHSIENQDEAFKKLAAFFGKNISWYWD
jgi:hypothetical protein